MNSNFTDRVRKVLSMAREEATRLHHDYVGTEHILLGLIREGEGVAAAILTNLEKGQVLEGVIKNMTNFGVFIDLGGVDGLLHITDISWGRINHPEEVLKLDQTVKVVVLDFDGDMGTVEVVVETTDGQSWTTGVDEVGFFALVAEPTGSVRFTVRDAGRSATSRWIDL